LFRKSLFREFLVRYACLCVSKNLVCVLGSLPFWRGSPPFLSLWPLRRGAAAPVSFVCAAWSLLCSLLPSLLLLLPVLLSVLRLLPLRLFALLPVRVPPRWLRLALVFLLLSLSRVAWLLPRPLFLCCLALCLLSLLPTLVVLCALLVGARSVACGPRWAGALPLRLLGWLLRSGLLVPLARAWMCGVLLVVVVCLARVSSALCLSKGFPGWFLYWCLPRASLLCFRHYSRRLQ